MSWNTSLVNRLRYYIGDIDESNEVWTNTQLAKLTAMAAIEVATEVSVNNITTKTFSIDTDIPTITPDPVTDNDLKDSGIGELFVLKAAYIIAISEYRKDAAKFGIRIRDDNTSFDGTGALKARSELITFYKENYEKAAWDWEMGNRASCRAILGPYSSADFALGLSERQYPLYYPGRRGMPYNF
jgi:hypothetical protein|tara:strand:+ start:198 stop:752 length:555 start_codon:yes stop_codon:yes gene_type:complete